MSTANQKLVNLILWRRARRLRREWGQAVRQAPPSPGPPRSDAA